MIRRPILYGRMHLALLGLGLLAVSAAGLLVASASQTTLIVAERELSSYWRTTYDILVRPAGSRSSIEEKYGLVEANHLSSIPGGITFEQYETIKSIPGVEVAAPISMIGYTIEIIHLGNLGLLTEPGAYVVKEALTTDDGVRRSDFGRETYYYADPGAPLQVAKPNSPIVDSGRFHVSGHQEFFLLVAGIDPPQEAALIGLDRAMVEGEYLTGKELLAPRPSPFDEPLADGSQPPQILITLPALINASTYISVTYRAELRRLALPPEVSTLKNILAHGGNEYLATLPGETLVAQEMDSHTLYRMLVEVLLAEGSGYSMASGLPDLPGAIVYREISPPFAHEGLVLEIVLPKEQGYAEEPAYRSWAGFDSQRPLNASYSPSVRGLFDIERIPRPADVNRVPLETYFPPIAFLRYDEQGRPVDPPRELRPTLNLAGYIQSPPLILTTLEAARALRGEAAISAIRMRVALEGCPPREPEACPLTPAAQRKIEAIAIEIQRRTGLDVNIMVGSSPKRILVHVPGIGYVEEQWIQKGVNLIYKQGIQSGNWLLLATLLVAGSLFTLDLSWAEVVARRRLIALQKALGWRSRTVFAQVLGQVLSIGAAAGVAGSLGALGVVWLLDWQRPPAWVLLGLPSAVLVVTALGSLLPAWLASRTPPLVGLQQGGLRYRRTRSRPFLGVWGYAWSGLLRRAGRTLLAGLTAVLSAGLLVLLVAVLLEQRGMLSGTLLGEFILVRVQGFHYAIVGIGFGLAALSTVNSLLAGVLERRREIGVLKAMGWRTGAVMRLFVLEGVLLGLVGGAIGALLGSLAFVYLYRAIAPGLALSILVGVGVPALVGALAALYPARVAARVLPAEAVRYE